MVVNDNALALMAIDTFIKTLVLLTEQTAILSK